MEFKAQYDPKQVEPRTYETWEKSGVFRADPKSKKEKYTIVLPPPNVTGILHMGHALTCTLEDILIRRKRMQGLEVLWLPGTDHAGIATQMVVERNLMRESKVSRHDLGREKFLEKVWEWKRQSEGTIISQLKLMGCSLDWSRLAFTLDEGVSLAVREVFTRLFNEKLIYRDKAITQYCPRCRTALSDLEVKPKETKGKFWHIKYLLDGDPQKFVVVATTRPETLLGDTAVAIHPEDERFAEFRGKRVIVPLVKRSVPVIADDYVDKEFGTGALKITPGHDANDFVVGKKHGLSVISLFDEKGDLRSCWVHEPIAHGATSVDLSSLKKESALAGYDGLSREKARAKVIEDLTNEGLLVKEVDHQHNVGHCDRCGVVVEPYVSWQWFVNAEVLAKEPIRAVETGEIKIIPQEWEKTYFEWMRNIRPWCISRQLWWGHRIPVWYCQSCKHYEAFVDEPKSCSKCHSDKLEQDKDVLDTWFSSGLWPFSTLGWPGETDDFKAFYPNSVMETGFDILFFWVARMIMFGMKMTGKIPFHTVYLHPMVRDEYGQKMSKTKGNVKDPLEIVERMGADALRFTLAAMSVHGRDVLLSDARIEGYRNFVNKLWNAARFVLMHFGDVKTPNRDTSNEVNRWIWSRFDKAKKEVNLALDQYRFFDAANLLYHFVWSEYCDWFVELSKSELEDRKSKKESTAVEVLEETLRLLHPLIPFVTEEIWQKMPIKGNEASISLSQFPKEVNNLGFNDSEVRIERLIRVVEAIRSKRDTLQVDTKATVSVVIIGSAQVITDLKNQTGALERLSKVSVEFQERSSGELKRPERSVLIPLQDVSIVMKLDGLIDFAVEKNRTEKELAGAQGELDRAVAKLANTGFTAKAPPDVLEGVRARKQELEEKVAALKAYLKDLT